MIYPRFECHYITLVILETSILSKPSTRNILLVNFYYKTKRVRCNISVAASSNAGLVCSSGSRTYV
nr:MAG TPA: hypothetical protein [Caudoviricetes sp.]